MDQAAPLPWAFQPTTPIFLPRPGLNHFQFQTAPGVHNRPPARGRPQQPSKAQWDRLKPLIRVLYIEEGKTLQNVIDILRQRDGFSLTTKQLTRKLGEWNFRKNVKSAERQKILESFGSVSGQGFVVAMNKNVTLAKLDCWRNDIEKDADPETISDHPIVMSASAPSTESLPDTLHDLNMASSLGNDQISHQVTDVPDCMVGLEMEKPPSNQDTLRVVSRMFAALNMATPNDLSPFCIPPPVDLLASSMAADDIHISAAGFEDIGRDAEARNPVDQRATCHHRPRSAARYLVDQRKIAYFPPADLLFKGPLNDLNPFPLKPFSIWPAATSKHNLLLSYNQNPAELPEKLKKLGRLFPETHPTIILLMKLLAISYENLNILKAASWYERVAYATERRYGRNSVEACEAWLEAFENYKGSGIRRRRDDLHQELHASLLRKFPPTHPLIQKSLYLLGKRASYQGQYKEAESHYRDLVQVRLVPLGPLHESTVLAFKELASTMKALGNFSRCEELLQIALYFHGSVSGISDHKNCGGMCAVLRVNLRIIRLLGRKRLIRPVLR